MAGAIAVRSIIDDGLETTQRRLWAEHHALRRSETCPPMLSRA
jgi:phage terminase large subunit